MQAHIINTSADAWGPFMYVTTKPGPQNLRSAENRSDNNDNSSREVSHIMQQVGLCYLSAVKKGKHKAVPLQAWSGPEGSRKLRFTDFMTTAQDCGKVVSLMHRPPLPPGNTPGTHFC